MLHRLTLHSDMVAKDKFPIVLFGSVNLKRISISAVLSGLTLQAKMESGHAAFTHKERLVGKRGLGVDGCG